MRFILFFLLLFTIACTAQNIDHLKVGAECTSSYYSLLGDKNIGLVVNQSSLVNNKHLVDVLLENNFSIERIFSPEHGFRGKADAGEKVNSSIDEQTGIPIVSLYGSNKKPKPDQLAGIDIVLFDLQDVGVRFYTYISTMHYVMEACADKNIPFIVLDRPNPNGDYFDGPVLEPDYKSFVGMHPIPIVHGLTVGELAMMINGESWLSDSLTCDLSVVKMNGWNHSTKYKLPIKPSPNLPNYNSIRLYPSLCLFEPTQISIGRGTYSPFEILGFPNSSIGNYTFTPQSIDGMSKYPKHENVECKGLDLRNSSNQSSFSLDYLLQFYRAYPDKSEFFTNKRFFNLLVGNSSLIQQLKEGKSELEIRASWQDDLSKYSKLRDKYLLYPKE
ncbi:exo-beta-N-acetylmuramidase NamZ family protein [Saccharicrinis aurantiacus]|uniref:exo-beta-N-acetylmuramidase NamZ family protein n=1 Tax=Saccharicrinis aurantiacus TaxID=1849719 RepID=UPI0009501B3C|nr:DUF1343 domain-containing protein [Saccharicrinis aurantiacus]